MRSFKGFQESGDNVDSIHEDEGEINMTTFSEGNANRKEGQGGNASLNANEAVPSTIKRKVQLLILEGIKGQDKVRLNKQMD